MKNYSEYSLSTGLLTSVIVGTTEKDIPKPQEGCAWVEGRYDHTKSKIDLLSGEVVPHLHTVVRDLSKELTGCRNELLSLSDWTQVIDCPLSKEAVEDWKLYRQALRDLTKQAGFPDSIVWPVKPESK